VTIVTADLEDRESPLVVAPPATEIRSPGRRLYLPAFALMAGTVWLLWIGAFTLERSGSLGATLGLGWMELTGPMVVALVAAVLVCERRWPAERRNVLARGHLHDGAFLALHLLTVVPLMTLLGVAFAELLGSHAKWIEAPWTASWPFWLLLSVTLVLMDGANWLAHWADHRFTLFWRLHAVHHSQEELSVLTSFRAHPFSHVPGFFLATVPVIALMGDRRMAPVLITFYVCLGTLPHANVPWSFGPLGRIIVSPAYHRLHHSIEGTNGLNLGVVLTVWDIFAGRAQFPEKGAPACQTGLPGRPFQTEYTDDGRWHPARILGQLTEPFGKGSSPASGNR
jgi:sterol desaturase/sphingolipid hydroxylase (fatty acid hydroxylase superfamily)